MWGVMDSSIPCLCPSGVSSGRAVCDFTFGVHRKEVGNNVVLTNRLLLVDDDEDFQKNFAQKISALGFRVDAVSSGAEALKRMERTIYDTVILDVLIPETDGIETLRRIKQLHPSTEVILLTGHGSVETALRGMMSGAFDYLVKPCEPDYLKSRIQRAQEKKEIEEGDDQKP